MLWTRVSVEGGEGVPVRWRVANDPGLADVVADGLTEATAGSDFTVKVEARGLQPGMRYWYGFEARAVRSPVGRTRTAPTGPVERLRLGVVSCAHWSTGFFNAYRRLAERDVDLVVHLGDYIYEDDPRASQGIRLHYPPWRAVNLGDYRARHAQYKSDPDLRALHQAHPVVAVWDDHELAGNAWRDGAVRHDPRTDGPWELRREAAVRAYLEWMPVRPPIPPGRLWRRVRLGDLCDLIVLDTRLDGRERPAAGRRPVIGIRRRDRALLSVPQRRWLAEELTAPGGRWRLLASQVVMAPIHVLNVPRRFERLGSWLGSVDGGLVVNPGQWDGYPDERQRLLDLVDDRPGEVVVLSGDLHSSWAADLHGRDGRLVASEFVVPAVSAPSFARTLAPPVPRGPQLLERMIRRQNPHVGYVDTKSHGYLLLDVTTESVEAQWWHVDTVACRSAAERCGARWTLSWGVPGLVHASDPGRTGHPRVSSRREGAPY